jgi:hypothetical protein
MTKAECAAILSRMFIVWPLRANETERARTMLIEEYAYELHSEDPEALVAVLREMRRHGTETPSGVKSFLPNLAEILELLRVRKIENDIRRRTGVRVLGPGDPFPPSYVFPEPPYQLTGEDRKEFEANRIALDGLISQLASRKLMPGAPAQTPEGNRHANDD